MHRHFLPTILLLVLISASSLFAAEFSGKVVGVIDGDTIDVLHNGRAERIRLYGIDCPEKRQAFGSRAKQATSTLAFGQPITITSHGHDRYGRTIGEVILPDGKNLNQELVREGMCWWYRKYAPHNATLQKMEAEAREAKRNLWADPNPIPPWAYRKLKRSRAIDLSYLSQFVRRVCSIQ